jgi:hypothetical protein
VSNGDDTEDDNGSGRESVTEVLLAKEPTALTAYLSQIV